MRAHAHGHIHKMWGFKSVTQATKEDHNNLFSVCLMRCEQNIVLWVLPSRCVYRQTVASMDTHKWGKKEEGNREAVLSQPSEIVMMQSSE